MAKKPDGKPASVDRVSFTRPAAERIGKAVRQVEAGDRDLGPIEWGPRGGGGSGGGKVFRVCTFTGAWAINSAKTVTFRGVTSTPNTVSATNLFFPITNTAAGSRDCAIAKDGTAWYLVDVRLQTATAIFVMSTQSTAVMTDVMLSASLNTSACTISIGKTLVTASRIFVTETATGTYLWLE
jgi:hypothetical protein